MPFARARSRASSPNGLPLEIIQVSASFTLTGNYSGRVIQSTAGSDIVITAPANLPTGFSCMIEQGGAGAVTVTAGTGATVVNRSSFVKTAGQYAVCGLYVRENASGISAAYLFYGDGSV
jgi:hypothetical protein